VALVGSDGTVYKKVRMYAQLQPDEMSWAGFIKFVPATGGTALLTDRETSQSHPDAVAYWASGLEPIYLEGALERAERRARVPRRPMAVARIARPLRNPHSTR
jgi:hypothetical protein